MSSTNLTLGGFTQPANIEKGLSQRFTWLFPKPTYANFETLQPIDTTFTTELGIATYVCLILFTNFFTLQLIILLKVTVKKAR